MDRVGRCWSAAWTAFSRTKTVDVRHLQDTELKRCLNVVDLIALGQPTRLIMVARCKRADRYIFAVVSFLLSSSFFPRLISAAAEWMSTILLHMGWP